MPRERPSKLDRKHQRDADRRDAIMTLDSWRPRILKRNESLPDIGEPPAAPSLPSYLRREERSAPSANRKLWESPAAPKTSKAPACVIDIAQIGAAAFRSNLRKKENILFQVSLYNIEREI